MDRKEATQHIIRHMVAHDIGKYPHVKLGEALSLAIEALQEKDHRCANCRNGDFSGVMIYCLLHSSVHGLDEYCSEWRQE